MCLHVITSQLRFCFDQGNRPPSFFSNKIQDTVLKLLTTVFYQGDVMLIAASFGPFLLFWSSSFSTVFPFTSLILTGTVTANDSQSRYPK